HLQKRLGVSVLFKRLFHFKEMNYMIPIEAVPSSTLNTLLFYTACLGILLLVGIIVRIKFKVFKRFVIPASLIAGFIGLILGPDVLGFLPVEMVQTWAGYSGILISVV